jgi:hypothetical protein
MASRGRFISASQLGDGVDRSKGHMVTKLLSCLLADIAYSTISQLCVSTSRMMGRTTLGVNSGNYFAWQERPSTLYVGGTVLLGP